MTTLITGAGLIGTSFAQYAVRRGEDVVFVDPQPREEYVRAKLGNADFKIIADDVRNLPGMIAAINETKPDTVVHTASLIGGRVGDPIHNGYAVNIGGEGSPRMAAGIFHGGGLRRLRRGTQGPDGVKS